MPRVVWEYVHEGKAGGTVGRIHWVRELYGIEKFVKMRIPFLKCDIKTKVCSLICEISILIYGIFGVRCQQRPDVLSSYTTAEHT